MIDENCGALEEVSLLEETSFEGKSVQLEGWGHLRQETFSFPS
jgi:hypothetical protein